MSFMGNRIVKKFEPKFYYGTIDYVKANTKAECGFYFHIIYDDNDQEDMERSPSSKSIVWEYGTR